MSEQNKQSFELALAAAMALPGVRINREEFLKKELCKYCEKQEVEITIKHSLAAAKIPDKTIEKIAKGCINYETNQSSIFSFAAGIPGGAVMAATIPADQAQYFAHLFRILQKLLYLYDCGYLIHSSDDGDGIDDETKNMLILLLGVMFGIEQAGVIIAKICEGAAAKAAKAIAQKALTKTLYYPVIKKIASMVGVKMTKEVFAKGVSKAVPVVGGIVSGGITYATFKPMSRKLQKYLIRLNEGKAIPPEYEDVDIIDIDLQDVDSAEGDKTGNSSDRKNEN